MKFIFPFVRRAAFLGLLAAASTGCDLLQQDSPQDFSPDDVFGSPARIDKAVVGIYDGLQDGDFLGSRALIYSDVRSDDVDPAGAFSSLAFSNIPSSDGFALGAWAGGYRSMYMANYVIRELEKRNGAGLDAARYNQYIGEAKFARALCHFTLVNLFAQPYNYSADASHLGIPIQLTAPDGTEAYQPDQQLARSSVREVYAQIERDLLSAVDQLPESQGGGRVSIARATKDAARGLLSRVYLYKGDNTNAARYAADIVNSNRHQLNTTAFTEFKTAAGGDQPLTSESIFFIAMSQGDNPNTNAAIGQHYAPTTGDITVTPYRNALPGPATGSTNATNTDRRRLDMLVLRSNRWWTRKYTSDLPNGSAGGSNVAAWIPIIRYPEILLTRAEALVKLAGSITDLQTDTTALHMLNLVRERSRPLNAARYTKNTFSTKEQFLDAVLRERRFELAFEGHRLYDLLRNGRNVPAHGTTSTVQQLDWKSPKSILPIPANEIARNPNLVQNDTY
ncbi:RagB/SusD family nutrient uptake outer membrane protein [Hymenobacter edaphi]|nr:RagB/SusD family nutrient uptake outer membrane protein [Hymenobacter edaphi]